MKVNTCTWLTSLSAAPPGVDTSVCRLIINQIKVCIIWKHQKWEVYKCCSVVSRNDFRLWLHFCSDSLRLKFSLKNKEAETVKKVRENETADSGGNRLQVCFPPLLMLICACPSFLSCSMLNWRNVVCVDFYTADVPVSEAMIRSAGVHFISINFHFFLKICFPSASTQTRFLSLISIIWLILSAHDFGSAYC